MSVTTDDELAVVGRVVKPHGIRGELVVEPLSDVPDRLGPGMQVEVGDEPCVVTGVRPHKGRLLLAVEGVSDRTEAERLRGAEVRAAPLALEDQEHLMASELVGLEVRREDGAVVGTVAALLELPTTAGYDLLEVTRPDGTALLLPAVEELVEVEVAADGHTVTGLVVVDPPDGLLEL